jgi:hypothetical protein
MGGNHLGRCLEHCFLEKLQDAGAHLSACDLLHLMEFDHIQVNEADLLVFPQCPVHLFRAGNLGIGHMEVCFSLE